eukprot:scaffold125461_cov66-Phaeocystis_antarctica.AAC.7
MRSASPHPRRRRSRPAAAVSERRATSGGACRHTRRGGSRSDPPQVRHCCARSCAPAGRPPRERDPRSQADGPAASPTLLRCWSSRTRRASRGRRARRRLQPAAPVEACCVGVVGHVCARPLVRAIDGAKASAATVFAPCWREGDRQTTRRDRFYS